MDDIGYSSGLFSPFVSYPYSDMYRFQGDLDLCIVYLYSWLIESLLYIYLLCGSHRGLLCNDITSFSTRTKVPGGRP